MKPEALEPPSYDVRLRFLRSAAAYPGLPQPPDCCETHMSWLFFAGEQVFKLKKPVRHPFLDFSTLAAREFYCREELRLNHRLAPGVYLGLMALQAHDGSLSLVPESHLATSGQTLDWLVHMRRLPADRMLSHLMSGGQVRAADIDALAAVLTAFYLRAPKTWLTPQDYLGRFQREQAANRAVLQLPQFQDDLRLVLPALAGVDAALAQHAGPLQARVRHRHVVDGHGDLRPEHVCLLADPAQACGVTPLIIDGLEFNAALRQVDPYDELAFLALECRLAGAGWIGDRLTSRCTAALGHAPSPALMSFYTAHRALLRARLALAHLLEVPPRTPEKWQPQAQRYIDQALAALPGLQTFNATRRPGSP